MAEDYPRYNRKFRGQRILIVEDGYFLADETRRTLEKLCAAIVGPTRQVNEALSLIAQKGIDAAILDIRFDSDAVFPLAETLEKLDIPYVFASGYNPSIRPDKFGGFVLSEKPDDLKHIARALFYPRRMEN